MPSHTKKFILFLAIITAIAGLTLFKQIKKAGNITTKVVEKPLINPSLVNIPITANDQILGNPGANLTIVEYLDLSDEKSVNLHQQLANIIGKNPMAARLVWKDLPSGSLFGDNTLPHRAIWCAGDQKKFWPFVEQLLSAQKIDADAINNALSKTQLNADLFNQCLNNAAGKQMMAAAVAAGKIIGVTKAPALFVNNQQINLDEDVDIAQMITTFIAQ